MPTFNSRDRNVGSDRELHVAMERPRTYELIEAELAAARRAVRARQRQMDRLGPLAGMALLGNTPAQRRRARQAQLLGIDDYYERIAAREAREQRRLASEQAAQEDAQDHAERAERRRAYEAELAAEAAEERRREIARANRSKFTKKESKVRYGQPRGEPVRKNPMLDSLSTEEAKREHLEGVWRYKEATGQSIAKAARNHNVSERTMGIWLRMWELLEAEYEKTGKWERVAVVRRAVKAGARPGDTLKAYKGKPRKRADLYPGKDETRAAPVNGETDAAAPKANHVTSNLIYSESYKKRHPGG